MDDELVESSDQAAEVLEPLVDDEVEVLGAAEADGVELVPLSDEDDDGLAGSAEVEPLRLSVR